MKLPIKLTISIVLASLLSTACAPDPEPMKYTLNSSINYSDSDTPLQSRFIDIKGKKVSEILSELSTKDSFFKLIGEVNYTFEESSLLRISSIYDLKKSVENSGQYRLVEFSNNGKLHQYKLMNYSIEVGDKDLFVDLRYKKQTIESVFKTIEQKFRRGYVIQTDAEDLLQREILYPYHGFSLNQFLDFCKENINVHVEYNIDKQQYRIFRRKLYEIEGFVDNALDLAKIQEKINRFHLDDYKMKTLSTKMNEALAKIMGKSSLEDIDKDSYLSKYSVSNGNSSYTFFADQKEIKKAKEVLAEYQNLAENPSSYEVTIYQLMLKNEIRRGKYHKKNIDIRNLVPSKVHKIDANAFSTSSLNEKEKELLHSSLKHEAHILNVSKYTIKSIDNLYPIIAEVSKTLQQDPLVYKKAGEKEMKESFSLMVHSKPLKGKRYYTFNFNIETFDGDELVGFNEGQERIDLRSKTLQYKNEGVIMNGQSIILTNFTYNLENDSEYLVLITKKQ